MKKHHFIDKISEFGDAKRIDESKLSEEDKKNIVEASKLGESFLSDGSLPSAKFVETNKSRYKVILKPSFDVRNYNLLLETLLKNNARTLVLELSKTKEFDHVKLSKALANQKKLWSLTINSKLYLKDMKKGDGSGNKGSKMKRGNFNLARTYFIIALKKTSKA